MKNHPATTLTSQDFYALIEHANIAVFLGDTEGNTLFANNAACDLFGYSNEELLQLHRNRLFNDNDAISNALKSRDENQAFQGQLTGIRKNGEHFPCEVFSVCYRTKDNQLRATSSIIDISNKVSMEQKVALSQQNIDLILNNTEASYLFIDTGLRIQAFNENTARETKKNLNTDLKVGTSFLDLTTPERRSFVEQICRQVLQGQIHDLEVEVTRPTGEVAFLRNHFKPAYNKQGVIIGIIISSTNITAEKNATNQLKLTEQRWRFALEGSNQGVWDWNIETGDVYFSPSWKRMFGFDTNDINFKIEDWEERIHPEDKALVQMDVKKHLSATDIYYQNEYRFRVQDGSYRWILSRGMLIEKGEDGMATRMIGTHTDITERKNIEENYKLLFNSNPLPMWTYDLETLQFVNVNNAAVKHYGYTKDEFLAMTIKDIRPKEDRTQFEQGDFASKEKKQFEHSHVRHLKKNGEQILVKISGNIIELNSKKTALVLVEDVTEKVKAEEELQKTKEHYELLFYNNPLPSYIYDTHSLKIIEVNHTALKHYGYTKEAFLSHSITSLWYEEDTTLLLKNLQKRETSETFTYNNVRHIKNDGQLFFANVYSNPIYFKERECRLVVVNDITAIITAQEALKKSNERFEYAAKASSDTLWEWDIATNIVYNSPAYFEIFGYAADSDRKHKNWEQLIHPDDTEPVITSFYEAIENPATIRWVKEYRYKKADDSYAYVLDKAFILRNETGKAIKLFGALQDISQQKASQLALEKSNERFTLARRATSDAIWDWDILTNELSCGEGLFHLFGHDEKSITIKRWVKLVHPEDREEVERSITTTLASCNTSWSKVYRFQKREGTYSYVLSRGFIVRNSEGKAIRMIGALQDISAQRYQRQLTSLELKMYEFHTKKDKSLQEMVSELIKGIESLHPQLNVSVSLMNDRLQKFYTISNSLPEEFISVMNRFPALSANNPFRKIINLKQPLIVEDLQTDPDWLVFGEIAKKYHIKSGWFIPITDTNHLVIGAFSFYYHQQKKPSPMEWNTITKLRNLLQILMENYLSVEELKRSNERFDIAIKATHDLIWDWDLETGKIYRDAEGLKNVYGIINTAHSLNIDEMIQRVHPEDQKAVKKMMRDILNAEQQEMFEVEYRFLRDDGTYSFVFDRGILILNEEGKPYRMIGAAQNVTERKKLEQDLVQKELERQKEISQASIDTQEQERAEIGKELHDNVNQVLTTTKLYLDLAQNNPELKDELIEKSNENVQYIINEIRQLSRSLMNPSIGDLGLIDALSDLTESINVIKKLKVQLSADPVIEKLLIENHKLMLYRIIQEALNNAVKHAEANKVLITLHPRNNKIELTIEDDGKGFNTHTVKKGAGLNNIQNRVYLTNGVFIIESEPNKGCKLKINLPLNKLEKVQYNYGKDNHSYS